MSPLATRPSLKQLTRALAASWAADTSAALDWSSAVPSKGQCAVSALVIQDELGGVLLRAVVQGESHYWNKLPDGREVDVTRSQFPAFAPVGTRAADRAYVLSFDNTVQRYKVLKERVAAHLTV